MVVLILFVFCVVFPGCRRAAPAAEPASGSSPAPELFTDVSKELHLDFNHQAGTNWFMADQVGSGCVFQDFDNDGRVDIYLVQNGSGHSNVLYRQLADRSYERVPSHLGAELSGRGMGAIAGDADNDGLADLVVTEYGRVRFLWNRGGFRFEEISVEAGIDNPLWSVAASWIDFDRDGWLDLVVGNYLDYDPSQTCRDVHGRRDFCSPEAFPGGPTRLWRNTTGGRGKPPRFADVTFSAGLGGVPGPALGLVCADFTGDGWPDIFCSDDGRPNRLFANLGNGTFREEAAARGLAFNAMGRTAANMGVAWMDFDGDALADLFVTHLTDEHHALYRQDRPGLFIDLIAQSGLQQQAWRGTGFGTVAGDFDNDGHPDIAIANGLVSRASPPQLPLRAGTSDWWAMYAQRPQLFLSSGTAGFRDASESNPSFCGSASVGRSLAVGDIDRDGGLDLLLGNLGGSAVLLRNNRVRSGAWIQFRLVDPRHGERDEIGTEVIATAAGRRIWALLQPATSYLSNHEPIVHLGLGDATEVQSVQVLWPDGVHEEFSSVRVSQRTTLRRGDGRTLPPRK